MHRVGTIVVKLSRCPLASACQRRNDSTPPLPSEINLCYCITTLTRAPSLTPVVSVYCSFADAIASCAMHWRIREFVWQVTNDISFDVPSSIWRSSLSTAVADGLRFTSSNVHRVAALLMTHPDDLSELVTFELRSHLALLCEHISAHETAVARISRRVGIPALQLSPRF